MRVMTIRASLRETMPSGPELEVTPGMRLRLARVHEFCGMARRRLALMAAGQLSGPVVWITPGWQNEALLPDGFSEIMDPGRLILARPGRREDLLWCAEEALRSGTVPLVVAELPDPPALTPVRRLQLAAEAGSVAGQALLGLLLIPGAGGAQGAESRWALDPAHDRDGPLWRLERKRARTAPPAGWDLPG